MKTFFAAILVLCYGAAYAQTDSTILFIERNGLFTAPITVAKEFKLYGLYKSDTSKKTSYKEIKIRWIKSSKTEFTQAGFKIDMPDIQGAFIVAVNFTLPQDFYVYENRDYLFGCNNNYLYPGKTFVLESYIHKWNGADYIDLSSTGTVSDSLTKITIKSRNKTITTVTGAIPKVILEGHFNGDGASDFVLAEENMYKMYLSQNNNFTTINCEWISGDIVPEF